jgi:hypothetical protein
MDVELAKNHASVAVLGMVGSPAPANQLLEVLLPSLLYIRVGLILDEALESYIDGNGLTMIGRHDFNGRICFLADRSLLKDPEKLHAIRRRRNELAHDTAAYDAALPTACGWSELEQTTITVDAELQHLSLAETCPVYRFHAGQEMVAGPGFLSNDYFYSLLLDGETVFKVRWPAPGARIISGHFRPPPIP